MSASRCGVGRSWLAGPGQLFSLPGAGEEATRWADTSSGLFPRALSPLLFPPCLSSFCVRLRLSSSHLASTLLASCVYTPHISGLHLTRLPSRDLCLHSLASCVFPPRILRLHLTRLASLQPSRLTHHNAAARPSASPRFVSSRLNSVTPLVRVGHSVLLVVSFDGFFPRSSRHSGTFIIGVVWSFRRSSSSLVRASTSAYRYPSSFTGPLPRPPRLGWLRRRGFFF